MVYHLKSHKQHLTAKKQTNMDITIPSEYLVEWAPWGILTITFLYFLPLFDANTLRLFFVKGPSPGFFSVLATNQGELIRKYIANVSGLSFNAQTGKREDGLKTQSNIFSNGFLQSYYNTWGLVFKPWSQKLLECKWLGNSTEIPFAEFQDRKTIGCEIGGLPHNMDTKITFEQEDLSEFFYLGDKSSVDIILSDYDAALKTFTHEVGKTEEGKTVDFRRIYGTKTEGSTMDAKFRELVYDPTARNAATRGKRLVNIAIILVDPADTGVKELLGKQATALVEAEVRKTQATSLAEAQRIGADAKVYEITQIAKAEAEKERVRGKALASAEKALIKAGVRASERQSIAIERTGLDSLALVPVAVTHETNLKPGKDA